MVIGGDSAGAASVSLHLAAFGGRDDGLFHAAAAESVSFATVYTVNESQWQFDNLAIRLGCVGSEPVPCLRNKTAVEIQSVNYNIPFPRAAAPPLYMYNPVIDGDMILDLTYTAFAKGDFIRVPVIFGDDTNGGTVFTPANTTTLQESDMFLHNQFPFLTLRDFATVHDLYPNPNITACPAVGCYWRQVSNAYGEMRYMCPGLFISNAYTSSSTPSYAYRWNVEDPAEIASGLGVPHTVELNAVFGPTNTNGAAPASYYAGGVNAPAVAVIQAYWTSFIMSYDPNTRRLANSTKWEQWDPTSKGRLLFSTGGATGMEDLDGTDLWDRCEFWSKIGAEIRQ